MLDQDLKNQLSSVFSQIESNIELVFLNSDHQDQKQLLELLNDVAETCKQIQVRPHEDINLKSHSPQFQIYSQKKQTGIIFKGIPNGHEFTSLIVAILNTDGKGKLPDQNLIDRIKKLKGPIRLQTYISLTCENCPDVVQALNLIALLHPDFQHEMIDGAYFQDDINRLGIQGVPSIFMNSEFIHSGKIQLLDLIKKLEDTFGVSTTENKTESTKTKNINLGEVDIAIIGGGPAGASAAIYSARKGLKTTIIAEKFGGQIQDTKGIENLISVIYTEGPQLSDQLYKHVTHYPVQILEHRRVEKIDKISKTIFLEGGEFLKAKSIIITTGAKWRELSVPGEKEYLGRGVAYCPHCDGPFYKGKNIAVVGGGNSGVEAAIDLAGIVNEITLFEFNDQLKADQVLVDKLKSLPNVKIQTSAKITSVIGDGKKVTGLEFEDRKNGEIKRTTLDGIFVQIGLLPNTQFLKDTIDLSPFGEIIVDVKGRTSQPGIYAAGDVTTTPFKQIIIAMGEGAKAALTAFEDLMFK